MAIVIVLSAWVGGIIVGALSVDNSREVETEAGGSSDNDTTTTTTENATTTTAETTSTTERPTTTTTEPTTTTTTEPPPTTTTTPPEPPGFGNGIHLVGTDIAPGQYRTAGPGSGEFDLCYWARLSGVSGEFDELIVNGIPDGPAVVEILPTDVAFESDGCGRWELVE